MATPNARLEVLADPGSPVNDIDEYEVNMDLSTVSRDELEQLDSKVDIALATHTSMPSAPNGDSHTNQSDLDPVSLSSSGYIVTGVVASPCAGHAIHGDLENGGSVATICDSALARSPSLPLNTLERNRTNLCRPQSHCMTLPYTRSNPSCYAVKGRELMLYKDFALATQHLASEHDAGAEASLMLAVDEDHALDWLTRDDRVVL
ncbi:hypothetical protein PILCRDRAFT_9851 [Piloderma croceum F 1598]|uniref:Uncharacterized protein n=1 Tax=Piloderma croceum (strain F 1598) TaxID=765440 RepID=A0A0C3BRJ8_PILCF|nr:hypothetical protein PILCRDRAFT_9851 [Piloderma croceum F 1598]